MSLVTHGFDLPIMPGSISPVLHLSQYDDARTFTAHLKGEDGNPFTLPNTATAKLEGMNYKGVTFEQACAVSGSDITFTPKEAATDQPGLIAATLHIKSGNENISTLAVILDVQKNGATKEEQARSPGFTDAIQAAVEAWASQQGFTSPTVSITEITGGHRITFTDAQHPQGQSIDVMDGEGDGIEIANTASAMTDQNAVYKYKGNETGYVRDALYFYNGSGWSQIVGKNPVGGGSVTTDIYDSSLYVRGIFLDYGSGENAAMTQSAGENEAASVIVPLVNGASYVINRLNAPRFRASIFNHYPTANRDTPVTVLKKDDTGNVTTLSYQCNNNGYYLMVYGSNSSTLVPIEILQTVNSGSGDQDDYFTTDKTLTKRDIPADAKAVGDAISGLENEIESINPFVTLTSNIYNENKYVKGIILDYRTGSTDATVAASATASSVVVPLIKGCSYVINRLNAPRFRVSVFDHYPAVGDVATEVLKLDDSGNVTTLSYDCTHDGYYLVVYGSTADPVEPIEIIQTGEFLDPSKIQGMTGNFADAVEFSELKNKLYHSAAYAHLVPAEDNSNAVSRFIQEMNTKAAKIGMTNSVFADVAGYETAVNRVTARDMVKLGIEALSYPELCRVWGKTEAQITTLDSAHRSISMTSVASGEDLTQLTDYYMTIGKKAGYMGGSVTMLGVCIVEGKAVVGAVGGVSNRANRPPAMKQLMDIVKEIMANGSATTTPTLFGYACAAVLPPANPGSYEQQNVECIYEYNADTQIIPASVTKVLTAIVALDNLVSLHDKMTVLSTDGLNYGSGQLLVAGDVINYEQALYLMLLPSSGPCCRVVARTLGQVMLTAYD